MTTNVFDCNVVAKVFNFQGTPKNGGLNLGSATFANNEVRTLEQIKAPFVAKVLLFMKLTSGAVTVKISINSGTADFGTPTLSRTVTDALEFANELATTSSLLYVDTQLTAGVAGCVIGKGTLRLEAKLAAGRSYHEAARAFNNFTSAGGNYSTALA